MLQARNGYGIEVELASGADHARLSACDLFVWKYKESSRLVI